MLLVTLTYVVWLHICRYRKLKQEHAALLAEHEREREALKLLQQQQDDMHSSTSDEGVLLNHSADELELHTDRRDSEE